MAQRIGLGIVDGSNPYAEIRAWLDLSGVQLTLWEAETVRHLSSVYLNAVSTMKDDDMLPPWMPEGRREALEAQIKAFDKDFRNVS